MDCSIDTVRICISLSAAAVFGIVMPLIVFAPRIMTSLKSVVSSVLMTPVRVMLAVLAVGALVSYAGTKPQPDPTKYTVEFVLPPPYNPIASMQCVTGTVYSLPAVEGCRWISDKTIRLYDGGMMFFDLAEPGETVRMTATQE